MCQIKKKGRSFGRHSLKMRPHLSPFFLYTQNIMQVSLQEKNGQSYLVVEAPVSLRPSKSGKTTLVASSNGNTKTDVEINGKPVTIGLNAYIPKDL